MNENMLYNLVKVWRTESKAAKYDRYDSQIDSMKIGSRQGVMVLMSAYPKNWIALFSQSENKKEERDISKG